MPAGTTGRPRFLASVTDAAEALTALAAGADIIDCKNPADGALGALPHVTVQAIVDAVAHRVPVSATVGDLAPDPGLLTGAVAAMAATGVDLVKIGVFSGGDAKASVAALGRLELGRVRLVGLLLADRDPDFGLVADMASAGFAGVMLDTAAKDGRGLPDVMAPVRIADFVTLAREWNLFVGLAGSLSIGHIASVGAFGPDIMGFRGALCAGTRRLGPLEEGAVRAVARELALLGRRPTARHAILEATP
jgi:uncharacterized protein (UPF0264 family)